MKQALYGGVALAVLALAGQAVAADLPVKAPPLPPPVWSWAGLYIGAHVGTAMGLNEVSDPFGPSIFGDTIHSPGFFGGVQMGYNWQQIGSPWVFGVEADVSLADLDGTNTCYAFSGNFVSLNCRAHTNVFGTATGRVGYSFGPFGRTLVYAKGGLAWGHSNVDSIVSNEPFNVVMGNTASTSFNSLGWTVGVGTEYAMTAHWTVRAEYDYLDLGKSNVGMPANSVTMFPGGGGVFVPLPGASVSQQIHTFKLGVNYKFGPDMAPFNDGGLFAFGPTAVAGPAAMYTKAAPVVAVWSPGWSFEGGARFWYSTGRFQKDIAPGNLGNQNPTLNISRLTWDETTGKTGEVFGRIDTPWNFFVKGFAGSGKLSGGKINDEDWGIPAAVWTGYSNTQGNASGNMNYWTIDAGIDVFRGAGYKVGAFVGYNQYKDNKSSTSCTQIALPASGICSPAIPNTFILGENDNWQSFRVGANAEVMVTDRIKVTTDVAFVPYTKFTGQDFHPLRPFVADEYGHGIGTQAELFVTYYVTPQFSVGAGGRYWAMWTTTGGDCREPPFGACPVQLQDMQFKTERFGALFQASYRWDQSAPVVARY